MTYIIYCHTNKVTGKRYVGLTKHPLMQVWQKRHVDLACRGRGFLLSRAIRVYGSGEDAWQHEVLEEGLLTKADASAAEVRWIAHFHSDEPEFGYNMTHGGEGTSGYRPTEEHKRAISVALTGRKRGPYGSWSEDVKQKDPRRGRHHSEEHKQHLREILTGRSMSHRGKPWSEARRAAQNAKPRSRWMKTGKKSQ